MTTTPTLWAITRTDDEAALYWAGGHLWQALDSELTRTFPGKQEAKAAYRDETGKRFSHDLDAVPLTDDVAGDYCTCDDDTEAACPLHDADEAPLLEMLHDAPIPIDVDEDTGCAELCTSSDIEVYDEEGEEDTTVHDGEVVDEDDLDKLWDTANRLHADFEAAGRSALIAAWNCGQALLAAKVEVETIYGYGSWKEWVEGSFNGSYRTAAVYMQIAGNVQIGQLAEHTSIAGVLKAIAAGKAGTDKPAPSMEKRAAAILKAARKFACVVDAFTADIKAGRHGNSSIEDYEADMDVAADLMTQAFRAYDIKQWGQSAR